MVDYPSWSPGFWPGFSFPHVSVWRFACILPGTISTAEFLTERNADTGGGQNRAPGPALLFLSCMTLGKWFTFANLVSFMGGWAV